MNATPPLCELCQSPVTSNRADWKLCFACTMTPRHARRERFGQAPYAAPPATQDEVTFIVPGAPVSKNRAHRTAYAKAGQFRGAIYKTDEARRFQASVQGHALQAICGLPRMWDRTRRFALHIQSYFDRSTADVGMAVMLTQDALQGVLYDNDRQLAEVSDRKNIDKLAPRLVVTVRAVE